MFYNGNDESDSDGDDDEGDNACVQYFRVQESDPNTTHRVPEHPLLPFLNLASQPTPVPGEDNNENDDKVETIKEASKENTCNIFLHDDVTCIFFLFIDFISTSFRLQTFRVMGGHEMLDLDEWGMVREYNVFLSWRGNGIYRYFYLYFSIFGERQDASPSYKCHRQCERVS